MENKKFTFQSFENTIRVSLSGSYDVIRLCMLVWRGHSLHWTTWVFRRCSRDLQLLHECGRERRWIWVNDSIVGVLEVSVGPHNLQVTGINLIVAWTDDAGSFMFYIEFQRLSLRHVHGLLEFGSVLVVIELTNFVLYPGKAMVEHL